MEKIYGKGIVRRVDIGECRVRLDGDERTLSLPGPNSSDERGFALGIPLFNHFDFQRSKGGVYKMIA